MQITIFEKFLPFSTRPGIKMLVPGTSICAKFYPTRIDFIEISGSQPKFLGHISIDLLKPKHPTVQLNLEKGWIDVWGESSGGFYRYRISAFSHSNALTITVLKGNVVLNPVGISFAQVETCCWKMALEGRYMPQKPLLEKISFGSHKKQDWDLVLQRWDMSEIFPFLYQLGQWIPQTAPAVCEGTASLLPACCQAIVKGSRNELLAPFEDLLRAGFEGLLSPTLSDDLHQGYQFLPVTSKANPLAMCVDAALLVRSMLIQTEGPLFKVLPALPVPFHCGRALNLRLKDKGVLDIEWSKKLIRRMTFQSTVSGQLELRFTSEIESFRLRRSEEDKGEWLKNGDTIAIEKDTLLFFDRFQK